jgi:hypothetical protein
VFKKDLKVFFLVFCLFLTGQTKAAMQSVTAHISFDTPASLVSEANLGFGAVKAGTNSSYAARSNGRIIVAGRINQLINIFVDEFKPDNGITLRNGLCSYDNNSFGPCTVTDGAAPGTGKILLFSMQASTDDDPQNEGRASSPTFTLSVVYQ